MLFKPGHEVFVITQGPGHLSLLSYGSKEGIPSFVVGAMSTNSPGVTKWLISFSHRYENFAFIWDGQGEAVYQIGSGLERRPVGRRWNVASAANRGAWDIGTVDVSNIVRYATNRDGATTAFIIPNNL